MSSNAKTSYSREVETVQPIPRQGDVRESLAGIFGTIQNCTIGKITVNVSPSVSITRAALVEKEFDELVYDIDV